MPSPEPSESKSHPEQLLREFTLTTAFALAFAFISPIVGLYSIFGLGIAAAGPGFWFGFPIVLAGQLLVALVFGMLASRLPLEGGVYQWSRYLVGPRYAWFAGWTYVWALPISMGAVALAGSHFLAALLGINPNTPMATLGLSTLLLLFTTWGNTHGRFILNAIVGLCIIAEIVASVGVGIVLLLFHRVHGIGVLVSGPGVMTDTKSIVGFFNSPLLMAVAIAGWALLGFESAGSIGEEVRNPERAIPRAMVLSLACVAAVVMFAALSLILSIPGIDQGTHSADDDPVASTLIFYFGPIAYKAMLGLFMVGFVASLIGTQASVSRVIWAFARDRALPGSRWLVRLSPKDKLPVNAILLTSLMAFGVLLFSLTNIYPIVVAFTTAGFYIAFAFPVLAAAWRRLSGKWQVTPFNLGMFTAPTIYGAAGWISFEMINIGWPRSPALPWYENWAVPAMALFIGLLGLVVRRMLRSQV